MCEHIFAVTCCIKGMKFHDITEIFSRFHKPGPTNNAIHVLVNKIKRTGSVHDTNRCGCPGTACESTEPVRQVFKEDWKLSVMNPSGRLNILSTVVHRILSSTLKKNFVTFKCYKTCLKKINQDKQICVCRTG